MDKLTKLLEDGYVLVSGQGVNAITADRLHEEGYKVAIIYPTMLN